MKYTQASFTLPASSSRISDKEWDRAVLTAAEFAAKYPGEPTGPDEAVKR